MFTPKMVDALDLYLKKIVIELIREILVPICFKK